MPRPKLFVGSSRESSPIAYGVQENLQEDFEVTVWKQNTFLLNKSTLEELIRYSRESDAAVMVFSSDDVAKIRGAEVSVTRDNVVFELGLFLGALGRDAAFVLVPDGENLHLPTDLAGITVATTTLNARTKIGPPLLAQHAAVFFGRFLSHRHADALRPRLKRLARRLRRP